MGPTFENGHAQFFMLNHFDHGMLTMISEMPTYYQLQNHLCRTCAKSWFELCLSLLNLISFFSFFCALFNLPFVLFPPFFSEKKTYPLHYAMLMFQELKKSNKEDI